MSTNVTRATDVAANISHLTDELVKAKEIVDDVIESGKHRAARLRKQATVAVEECVEDTTHFIKKHPWQAVGVAAFIGTAAGLILSLVFTPLCTKAKVK